MILKEEHTYGLDDAVSYSLIDNVEKIDVGEDINTGRSFVTYYLKGRKDANEKGTLWVEDTTIYVCNDTGKTLSIIRPKVK